MKELHPVLLKARPALALSEIHGQGRGDVGEKPVFPPPLPSCLKGTTTQQHRKELRLGSIFLRSSWADTEHDSGRQEPGQTLTLWTVPQPPSSSLKPTRSLQKLPLTLAVLSWRRKWQTPLQYSCLENSMDRGAWRAAVHGVTLGVLWESWHLR